MIFESRGGCIGQQGHRRRNRAIGDDSKGKISLVAYSLAIPLAFLHEWISMGIYFAVAALWFIPDRRIEAVIEE